MRVIALYKDRNFYVFACFDYFIMPFIHILSSLTHTQTHRHTQLHRVISVSHTCCHGFSSFCLLYICHNSWPTVFFTDVTTWLISIYPVLSYAKFFISENSLFPKGSLRIYFYGVQFLWTSFFLFLLFSEQNNSWGYIFLTNLFFKISTRYI